MKKEYEVYPLYKDLMFKYIFGTDENKEFAIDMFSEFFRNADLTDMKITNSVKLDPKTIYSKGFEMDVLYELKNGEKIVVEMYTKFEDNAKIKSCMYVQSTFIDQLKAGDNYDKTKSVTQVNLIKNMKSSKKIKRYLVINENDLEDKLLPDLFSIYVIDVDNKQNEIYTYNISEKFQKWLDFIAAETLEEMESIVEGNEIMKRALNKMKKFSGKNWVHAYYGCFNPEKLIRSQCNSEFEKKLEKKLKKTAKENLEQGENNSKIEIAKNMLQKNMDINLIGELTSLSIEQIEELKENN